MRLTTRGLVAATVAAGFAFTAACSSPDYIEPNPPSEAQVAPDQQFNQLMQRPDLDEVVGRYEEMRGKIKSRLQSDLAMPEWLDRSDGVDAGCTNEFPEVHSHDAGRKSLNHFTVAQGIPADQWPRAKAALTEIGAEYGFTTPGLDASKPPYFNFMLKDEFNAELSLSTNKETVLSLGTGCHLYPETKQRGTPKTRPTY